MMPQTPSSSFPITGRASPSPRLRRIAPRVVAAIAAVGVALAATAFVRQQSAPAAPATTRPADGDGRAERPEGPRGPREGGRYEGGPERGRFDGPRPGGGDGRGGPSPRREPTEQEWQETLAFLEAHSPRRLEIYRAWLERAAREDGGDGTTRPATRENAVAAARSRIFGRVQGLRRLEQDDPPLYAFALAQFELEDQVTGALQRVREARRSGDDAAGAKAEAEARSGVRQYVENALSERRERIAHLERELEREKQRLARDEQEIDGMMARLLDRFGRGIGSEEGRGGPPRRRGEGGEAPREMPPATRPADGD